MNQIFNIREFLDLIETSYRNSHALSSYSDGVWRSLSTREYATEVRRLALALAASGVKKGDRVGILALPNPRWTIADCAIMAAGAISVPLFANISDENFRFQVKQTEMKAVLVGDQDQWMRYELNRDLFDKCFSLEDVSGDQDALGYREILALGQKFDEENPGFYEKLLSGIQNSDIATIIYTSGSTGIPKGAVHTHHSLFSLLNTPDFRWNSNSDSYLSFLPLAHVFARVLNFIMLAWGIPIYYFNDIKSIAQAAQEVHPTVMVVVPRLLEKMYAKMEEKIDASKGFKRWIGKAAFACANADSPRFCQKVMRPLFDLLVFRKLRAVLGGRLRVVFSGGAALSPTLYRFFLNCGFPIFEGWGLTEACPISVNRIGKVKIGTVGPALPGFKVTVSNEGELLVKGEMLMKGYYKNDELTRQAFDEAGWLKTGDRGAMDDEGYITILGRFKELLKTSTGEMIAPVPIEQALAKAPFVDLAMVIGDNKKFASCLIVPDFDYLKKLKEKAHQSHLSDEEFLKSPYMKNEMAQLIKNVNDRLNHWEKLHDYRFIPRALSVDLGEMTPTMKLKRDAVEQQFQPLIESIYAEDKS